MVNKEFIEGLFEKYKSSKEQEVKDLLKILEEKNEEEKVEKVITSFSSKIDLAEQLILSQDPNKQIDPIMPLYYDESGLWWKWHGGHKKWKIIDEIDLMNHITWSSPANTIISKERVEIIQALKQVARANRPEIAKKSIIQFGDEVIDIETGERGKASHQLFLTNPIPYKLGKCADTPTIDKIFAEWVGEDKVMLLKEIIAYSLIPDYPIHRIFCFIGSGMNGKSCFLNLLRKFIGSDNCCSTELDTLIASRFEVTRLHKKLVCQMGETNFSEIQKTSKLKSLSGGDLIGFEYKNKTPFEDKNYAKIIIATNNLPATTDKTIGFYRRWLIVDFPHQFSEKKNILSEIPEEEYNNLAYACIGILIELLKKREFTNEGTIEEKKEAYESRSNFLEKFIKEFVKYDINGYITKADFSKKFNSWCKENRHREMAEASIGKAMKKLDIETDRKFFDWLYDGKGGQLRCWMGINWKN